MDEEVRARCQELLGELARREVQLRDDINAVAIYRTRVMDLLAVQGHPETPEVLFTEVQSFLNPAT